MADVSYCTESLISDPEAPSHESRLRQWTLCPPHAQAQRTGVAKDSALHTTLLSPAGLLLCLSRPLHRCLALHVTLGTGLDSFAFLFLYSLFYQRNQHDHLTVEIRSCHTLVLCLLEACYLFGVRSEILTMMQKNLGDPAPAVASWAQFFKLLHSCIFLWESRPGLPFGS